MLDGLFDVMLRVVGLRPVGSAARPWHPVRISSRIDTHWLVAHAWRNATWGSLYPCACVAVMGGAMATSALSVPREPLLRAVLDAGVLVQYCAALLYFNTDHIDRHRQTRREATSCRFGVDHVAAIAASVVALQAVCLAPVAPTAASVLSLCTDTIGTYAAVCSVLCATIVLLDHTHVLRVYGELMETMPSSPLAREEHLSTMLGDVMCIRESLTISASVLYGVYSSVVVTSTLVVGIILFEAEGADGIDPGSYAFCALAAGLLLSFFGPVYLLSKRKDDVKDIISGSDFAHAYILRCDEPAAAAMTTTWVALGNTLDDTWFEVRVLGLPLHNGHTVQQLAVGVGVAVAYVRRTSR